MFTEFAYFCLFPPKMVPHFAPSRLGTNGLNQKQGIFSFDPLGTGQKEREILQWVTPVTLGRIDKIRMANFGFNFKVIFF